MHAAAVLVSLSLVLLLWCSLGGAQANEAVDAPEWVRASRPIKASEIPAKDYPYLARWLDKHGKPPQQYFVDLFASHQIVIFGEGHNVKEDKDFIIELIPRLYHEAGVRCIGWEFSSHVDDDRLEKLVASPRYDQAGALDFARDQFGHEWNSKEHWDIVKAVWQLNRSLRPSQEKMRLCGLRMSADMVELDTLLTTKPKDSPEYRRAIDVLLRYDTTMADQVEKEIIDRDRKGLVFVGRCHDFTHYEFPPTMNEGRPIMGNLLHERYGDRVFQVFPYDGFLSDLMEPVMKLRGQKPAGFDLYASPFANVLSPPGWDAPEVPMSRIARGFVYIVPATSLHKNTPIKGFVTEEMFKRYGRYYEIAFGRRFSNAKEVDEYLQTHRFPVPHAPN
jgi:hypothetical protein